MSFQLTILDDLPEITRVAIDGSFTIYHVREIQTAIESLLEQKISLEIHLHTVEDFDTSALQYLLYLKKMALQHKKRVCFAGHSDAVLKLLDLYGAIGLLADKVKISAQQKKDYCLRYGLKKAPKFLRL